VAALGDGLRFGVTLTSLAGAVARGDVLCRAAASLTGGLPDDPVSASAAPVPAATMIRAATPHKIQRMRPPLLCFPATSGI